MFYLNFFLEISNIIHFLLFAFFIPVSQAIEMSSFFVYSSRFGKILPDEKSRILFPSGIWGFHQLRTFILFKPPQEKLFAWLQSCQNPSVAFPLLSSELCASRVSFHVSRYDLDFLHAQSQKDLSFFNIVHIPHNRPKEITVNLKAPIALNWHQNLGKQLVLQEDNLPVNHSFFDYLQHLFSSSRSFKESPVPERDSPEAPALEENMNL